MSHAAHLHFPESLATVIIWCLCRILSLCWCLRYLLSDDISSLCGVLALVDDITDLLVTQQEVDAIGGQGQERVVGVLDLQTESKVSDSGATLTRVGPLKVKATEGQRSDSQ